MLHFDIENKKSFEFSVGDAAYAIPALDELPADMSRALMTAFIIDGDTSRGVALMDAFMAILNTYAEGVTSILTHSQLQKLLASWDDFTAQTTGADLGE